MAGREGIGKKHKGQLRSEDFPGEDEQGTIWAARRWNQRNVSVLSMLGMI